MHKVRGDSTLVAASRESETEASCTPSFGQENIPSCLVFPAKCVSATLLSLTKHIVWSEMLSGLTRQALMTLIPTHCSSG
jgi:hypothetical protein